MSARSLCAFGVLLCFLSARPCFAQNAKQDSGYVCIFRLWSALTELLTESEATASGLCESEIEARRLYLEARLLQIGGKTEDAYVTFQQVHLVNPTSSFGQRAMQRIHEIETQHRACEALKTGATIPLGTVDDVYY